MTTPAVTSPEVERLWAKVDKDGPVHPALGTPCWLWTAGKKSGGYGAVRIGSQTVYAHRAVYELVVGPIPEGLHIDHLCRRKECVNPAHLEPVTQKENVLRGESPMAQQARQTHCIHGHEFTPENTYTRANGARMCRTCLYRRTSRNKKRRRQQER